MTTTATFHSGLYELACSAVASDNGKFHPALVITKNTWPTRPRTIAVRRDLYPTPDGAIEAAREQGLEWVRNYG
jgi:hypothetical protein